MTGFFASVAFRLLGIKAALKRLFDAVAKYPWQAALLVSLVILGLTWHGKTKALKERDDAVAGRAADRLAYVKAQKEAKAAQLASHNTTDAVYRGTTEKIDHAYPAVIEQARSSGADYAFTHRLRDQAACRPSSGPLAAPVRGPAPGDGGTGADAIVVSREDFDTLTENSARLGQVHEWGEALIASGYAITSSLAPSSTKDPENLLPPAQR